MIEEISIRDLGVIGDAKLIFSKGLTAITGETGAGKTMVLSALGLLLGERSDSSSVRRGQDAAFVEGRYLDVLAANPLVTALSPNVRVGENRLRSVFLDPADPSRFLLYEEWADEQAFGVYRSSEYFRDGGAILHPADFLARPLMFQSMQCGCGRRQPSAETNIDTNIMDRKA